MYEELVKRLRKRAVNLKEKFTKNAELLAELTEAADAIDELDTLLDGVSADNDALCETIERLKKPRWIPVTERLPEEWKSVLTYQPYKNDVDKPLIRVSWYIGAGIWRECEQANTLELPVTHWMPLPEPPKEKT